MLLASTTWPARWRNAASVTLRTAKPDCYRSVDAAGLAKARATYYLKEAGGCRAERALLLVERDVRVQRVHEHVSNTRVDDVHRARFRQTRVVIVDSYSRI